MDAAEKLQLALNVFLEARENHARALQRIQNAKTALNALCIEEVAAGMNARHAKTRYHAQVKRALAGSL